MLDTDRPCKEHSFITNVDDVQNMQDGLLQLMREFETGKLSAFGESLFGLIYHTSIGRPFWGPAY